MRLSTSSINTFSECQRKFAHRYWLNTAKDSDYREPTFFQFGDLCHKILERCKHDYRACNADLMKNVCAENGMVWEKDGAKAASCLRGYFSTVDLAWKPIANELDVKSTEFTMKMDSIIKKGELWRIRDTKFIGIKMNSDIVNRLVADQQIALYVAHKNLVASMLDLDPKKFDGFSYVEIEKPRQKWNEGENWPSFTKRCGNAPCRETVMTESMLSFQETNLKNIYGLKNAIEAASKKPTETLQNTSNCKHFGSVCPYYSQCHGTIYSLRKEIQDELDLF